MQYRYRKFVGYNNAKTQTGRSTQVLDVGPDGDYEPPYTVNLNRRDAVLQFLNDMAEYGYELLEITETDTGHAQDNITTVVYYRSTRS